MGISLLKGAEMSKNFVSGGLPHLILGVIFGCLVVPTASLAQERPGALLAPQAVIKWEAQKQNILTWRNDEDFAALLNAIRSLSDHGLNPTDYHLASLQALQYEPEKRDRLATDAWFSAASHMVYGKLNPVSVEPDWTAARRSIDLAVNLDRALTTHTVGSSLEALAPTQPGYKKMQAELRNLAAELEKPSTTIAAGPAIRKGDSGPRIEALNARLSELSLLDLDETAEGFSERTENAVKIFQKINHLDTDGIVGVVTITVLNRDKQHMLDQVRVNLERWRWLPDDLGSRHVRANIADYSLSTWENGKQQRTHAIIVGKPYRKTPVFSDQIEYLILNPWWETPPSIAKADKLPAFRKDPGAVNRLGFHVLDGNGNRVNPDTINWTTVSSSNFPYRLRQAPGEQNALGQIKIMFPNIHNVYIHDTPTRGLFAQQQRAFSSGCLRTQDPVALGAWLLSQPDWNRDRLDTIIKTGKETRINLTTPVAVHVLYSTVVPDPEGSIRYLHDVYARDAIVLTGLNKAPV